MFTCVTQVSSHVWMGPSARIDMAHYAKAAVFQTSSHSFTDLEEDQSGSHSNNQMEQIWHGRYHVNENQLHSHS